MKHPVPFRIVLQDAPPGIDFGIQKGKGNQYETIQIQTSSDKDLQFQFSLQVNQLQNGASNFSGPLAQGNASNRFVYIDIGSLAGQKKSCWERRLKIPLFNIRWEMINQIITQTELIMETIVHGTGKDGGPNCGTVKPFLGWHVSKLNK